MQNLHLAKNKVKNTATKLSFWIKGKIKQYNVRIECERKHIHTWKDRQQIIIQRKKVLMRTIV